MVFVDTGFIEKESHIIKRNEQEINLYLYAEYEVQCTVERYNHCGSVGDDLPDVYDCECVGVDITEIVAYTDDGEEIQGFRLTAEEKAKLERNLMAMAEDDYAENGSWRK